MLSMDKLVCNSICTLAVGDHYANTTSSFLSSLPSEIKKYCLTDLINLDFGNSKVVKFQDDFTPIWQQKRTIIKEALKENEDTIFIDGDYEYHGSSQVVGDRLPGIYSWKICPMKTQTVWHPTTLPKVVEDIAKIFKIDDWTQTIWVAPNLFQIKKDKNTNIFFDAWDQIAFYLREHKYKINDGISIGLAAYVAGYTPVEDQSLLNLHQDLKHLFFGRWATDGSMT
jgi:hypothetical protein